jgi:hypothetical protein
MIVVNNYVEDLINIWGDEFTAKVEAVRSSSIYMYCFMFCLIIVIHPFGFHSILVAT